MQGSIASPPITIVEPRLRPALSAAGSLAFVVAGIWMMAVGQMSAVGLGGLAVAFFGFTLVRWTQSLLRPGVLTLSRDGIELRQAWRTDWRPWSEVADIRPAMFGGAPSIYVDSRNGGKTLALEGWGLAPNVLVNLVKQARSTWSTGGWAEPHPPDEASLP